MKCPLATPRICDGLLCLFSAGRPIPIRFRGGKQVAVRTTLDTIYIVLDNIVMHFFV